MKRKQFVCVSRLLKSLALMTALTMVGFLMNQSLLAQDKKENTKTMDKQNQKIILGGGCFWCVEAVYQRIPGVVKVRSGYAGGTVPNPSYEQICTGKTGHAEVIEIEYDPAKVTLDSILDIFWEAHNPTTLNRQGADTGTQYRSTIMYTVDEQKQIAEKSKAVAQKGLSDNIVTEIVPLQTFYVAEDYHQDYYNQNKSAGYCRMVIKPKLDKLKLKD